MDPGGVPVEAQRVRLDPEHGAVDRLDLALRGQAHRPLGDLAGVVQHGTVLRSRHEGAVREVGAVGEGFGEDGVPGVLGDPQQG